MSAFTLPTMGGQDNGQPNDQAVSPQTQDQSNPVGNGQSDLNSGNSLLPTSKFPVSGISAQDIPASRPTEAWQFGAQGGISNTIKQNINSEIDRKNKIAALEKELTNERGLVDRFKKQAIQMTDSGVLSNIPPPELYKNKETGQIDYYNWATHSLVGVYKYKDELKDKENRARFISDNQPQPTPQANSQQTPIVQQQQPPKPPVSGLTLPTGQQGPVRPAPMAEATPTAAKTPPSNDPVDPDFAKIQQMAVHAVQSGMEPKDANKFVMDYLKTQQDTEKKTKDKSQLAYYNKIMTAKNNHTIKKLDNATGEYVPFNEPITMENAQELVVGDPIVKQTAERTYRRDPVQFNIEQWQKAGKELDALKASSKSAIGIATTANIRANRALSVLNDPNATPQDIQGLANTDIAGIMKGGVPDEQLIKSSQYDNLANEYAKTVQYLLSSPQASGIPKVKEHLIKVVNELKDVDNQIITKNAGRNSIIFKELAESDPERWSQLIETSVSAGKMDYNTNNPSPSSPKPQAKDHPKVKGALLWIKEHPNAPETKEIKKRLGL